MNSHLFSGALALALALAPVSSVEPPSSVDPPETAKLHVTYAHVLTQACTAERKDKRIVCHPQTAPLRATTALTLVPISPRLQVGVESDRRKPLDISVDTKNPVEQDLTAGRWRVAWPGYDGEPTFAAAAGQTVELRLSLVEGRCEPGPSECRLVSGVVRRQAELANAR